MRKRFAVLLVAGLASSYVPAYAGVNPPGPGVSCEFSSQTDPSAEPDTQSGQLAGGPLVLTDSSTHLPGSGTLTCRVQINHKDHLGTGPEIQGHGTGVVTAGPAQISYHATPDDDVYLCAEFTDDSDGTTYYYDATNAVWTTDPSVDCGRASGGANDDGSDPLNDYPCPLFANLPSPVAELLQDTWQDCHESTTEGEILMTVVNGQTIVVAEPTGPAWACDHPIGSTVAPEDSDATVTCTPVAAYNSRANCRHLDAEAATGDANSAASAKSECQGGAVSISIVGGPAHGKVDAWGTWTTPWKCTIRLRGNAAGGCSLN